MAKLLVLHGPNLNLLGEREPGIYGRTSLAAIDKALLIDAQSSGHTLESFQSNAEHELIDRVHAARGDDTAFILINPAGLTHTSVSLRDALAKETELFLLSQLREDRDPLELWTAEYTFTGTSCLPTLLK